MEESIKDIRGFIATWNSLYPLDYIYRKKHNIAFNSSDHREIDILAMRFDIEEDLMYKESRDEDESYSSYIPATANFVNQRDKYVKMSEEDTDKLFDMIEIGEVLP